MYGMLTSAMIRVGRRLEHMTPGDDSVFRVSTL